MSTVSVFMLLEGGEGLRNAGFCKLFSSTFSLELTHTVVVYVKGGREGGLEKHGGLKVVFQNFFLLELSSTVSG